MLRLVLPSGRRIPLAEQVTIGRASDNTVQVSDPTVSRHHARIAPTSRGATIEDAGSTAGTWLDGRRIAAPAPLHDGTTIAVGRLGLLVEEPRAVEDEGLTIESPVGASMYMPATGTGPRLRSGWALKRLDSSEGDKRWVLKSLRTEDFVRLADEDAELLDLLDGRGTSELVELAERRFGSRGPVRLASLLADLADRGLIAGVDQPNPPTRRRSTVVRMFTPHELVWKRAGEAIDALYRVGGRYLLNETAVTAVAMLAAVGVGAFAYLVAGRYGTPFVVARKVGLGALVFIVGRLAIAAVHEAAHGITMASFGRRVHRAGVKLIAIFPFVFVDTSDAWLEARARRIAISSAGPVSDFTLAGAFSLACLGVAPGALRDVLFQLAFAAYVGGIFNLNPFVDRDGYQILADVLREPGLRRRAREQLRRRLTGKRADDDSALLTRYTILGLGWTVVGAGFAAVMSLRYRQALDRLVPSPVVYVLLALLWLLLLTPLLVAVGGPLLERWRVTGGRDGGL
jgi:pSer/pThr/pTyr-binding forkhead associated (FHA) protein/Zn-dependent protease